MSYYIHQIPGRIRVKSPVLKGNTHVAQKVCAWLGRVEGVHSTAVNPLTGSIVIEFAPKVVAAEEILCMLDQAGYFDRSKALTNDQYIHAKVTTTGQIVWGAISGAFMESVLGQSPFSLISILI